MIQVLVAEVIARAHQERMVPEMVHPSDGASRGNRRFGSLHKHRSSELSARRQRTELEGGGGGIRRNGNYFIPLSYPEGCPLHPSYPSGHATAAGAAVTVLKWFFDDSFVIPNPLTTTFDGPGPRRFPTPGPTRAR